MLDYAVISNSHIIYDKCKLCHVALFYVIKTNCCIYAALCKALCCFHEAL